jgi:CheY-like chemotaxis protein
MKKILVVDDEELIRELAQCILEKAGYECQTAEDGKEALAIISNGFVPDLVLTDVNMPILNGLGLAYQLQLQKIQVPIVFMSGDLRSHNLGELHKFSSHLLEKPFKGETLVDMVRYVLSQLIKPIVVWGKVQTALA